MHRSLLYNRQAGWQHRPHRRKLLPGRKFGNGSTIKLIVFIRSCSIHIYTSLHTSYIHTIHIIYRKTDTQAFINILYSFIHTYIHTYSTYIHTCIHRQISWITSNRFDTTVRDVTLTEGTTITNGFYVVWSVLTWSRVYRQPVHRVEIRTYFLHSMHNIFIINWITYELFLY